MRFCWYTIKTKEMEKSREFYGGFLGMRAERSSSPAPGTEIVFFSDENRMEVELISKEEIPEWQGECPVTIGFRTDGFDRLLDESREKGILDLSPVRMGKDMECFFIHDPNGVKLQIIRD